MLTRVRNLLLLPGLAVLALGGCTTTGEPAAGSTVMAQADYLSYDTQSLFDEAALIVEGTALATESTVLMPRFQGDTPEDNPLLGLSEEEKERAMEGDDGVPATVVKFQVDIVHQGDVMPGQEVTILQSGGVIDGVTYLTESEVMLAVGEDYLLFAADSFDGAFTILGGSAGTYLSAGDGVFTAAAPEVAPSQQFTTSEVAALAE